MRGPRAHTLLTFPKSRAKPDVVVGVGTGVVQVQGKHPIHRRVVPIATPDREPL